jgi:hypothetical protein
MEARRPGTLDGWVKKTASVVSEKDRELAKVLPVFDLEDDSPLNRKAQDLARKHVRAAQLQKKTRVTWSEEAINGILEYYDANTMAKTLQHYHSEGLLHLRDSTVNSWLAKRKEQREKNGQDKPYRKGKRGRPEKMPAAVDEVVTKEIEEKSADGVRIDGLTIRYVSIPIFETFCFR